jgi:hypothetical protein
VNKYSIPHDLHNDVLQLVCLVILEYDNAKLNKIVEENHLNAFVTGILVRQLYSKNSPFYREFRKFQNITSSIDDFDTNTWTVFK